MAATRWVRVKEALAAQLEADSTQRGLLLEETRRTDPSLAREVESLLASWDSKAGFLEPPAPSRGPALASGSRLGPYEVVAPLGSGGMGEVYRARDLRLGREVALKVLPASLTDDSAARSRFEREARAVAALSHPNIVALHDFSSGPPAHAVSELLEGSTLAERLRDAPLGPDATLRYARQIAEGLAAAHEKGIVHRDLKPANIFVTQDERVKILDFGLAKQLWPSGVGADTQATRPGLLLGTIGYMSPEQVRGEEVGPASDVFSFGAVLYEALTGRSAFQRENPADTLTAILRDDAPDLGLLPARFRKVVRRCLSKRPEERFASGAELRTGLESAASAGPGFPARFVVAPFLVVGVALLVGLEWRARGELPDLSPSDSRLAFRGGGVDGAEYARIPAGRFIMGCMGERDCPSKGRTEVTFERPYWMMRTEVTVLQFRAFARATGRDMPVAPSFDPDWRNGDHPISNVTWFEAGDYCQWAGGRLPSDAEWERAARATHDWRFEWGTDAVPLIEGRPAANVRDEAYARKYDVPSDDPEVFRGYDDGFPETSPVSSFPPNDLGLFDMTGNVAEWVADKGRDTLEHVSRPRDGLKDVPRDGRPWEGGDELRRVLRPSNWQHGRSVSHVYDRLVFSPYGKASVTGFRCARDSAP